MKTPMPLDRSDHPVPSFTLMDSAPEPTALKPAWFERIVVRGPARKPTGHPRPEVLATLGLVLVCGFGLFAEPPILGSFPASRAVFQGSTTKFTARCYGDTAGNTYQWYRNGDPLPGATSERLLLTNLQASDDADYTLRVTNPEGSIESERVRLYVVRPIDDLAVGEVTDDNGLSLPYLYNLPAGYDPQRAYPMCIALWGSGLLGFDRLTEDIREFPWATVLRSYGIEARHPTVLVFPARRPGVGTWEQPDYPLLLGMIDQLIEELSIDMNRVQLIGFSDGGRTAWELTGERPDFFASVITWATTGEPPDPQAVNPLPAWLFCAADGRGQFDRLDTRSSETATMFLAAFPLSPLGQDPAHGLGSSGEEMSATFPPLSLGGHESEVGLMDEFGGMEGLPRGLVRETAGRQTAQFLVDEGDQFLGRAPFAPLNRLEDDGGVAHGTSSPCLHPVLAQSSGGHRLAAVAKG
jgi:pimeloyl-ACP methyl ester carboxylesterase